MPRPAVKTTGKPDRATGPSGFDFSRAIRLLCADMIARLPPLAHIELDRVAIGFAQARGSQGHGLQATLTPLRFEGGSQTTVRRGRKYCIERLFDPSGHEYLYILSFYLPRFLNHTFDEKIVTILHELWHIGPQFDGDLRRFTGRYHAHGPSQKRYDQQVEKLARRWLATSPPEALHAFLRLSFSELKERHGQVYGQKIRAPKLIACDR